MGRRPTYTAHNEAMESIMGIFIDALNRHKVTLGNDEYLQLECDIMDVLCNKYVKKDATVNLLLGQTVEFGNHRWIVAHIEGEYAYLMLDEALDQTVFGTDDRYVHSVLLKAIAAFMTSGLPADALAQCQDVTVNGVTAKVFVPSYEQLSSEWDWPAAAKTNRIYQYDDSNAAWWTSSSNNTGYVFYVGYGGYFITGHPSNSFGFRPAVKVKISAIEPPRDSDNWETVSERLNSVVPENMFHEMMNDTVSHSPAMEKATAVRQKTGAGMVESYIAIKVCNEDIDLAAKMLIEHHDAFKKKANVIYAIGMK